MKRLELKIPPPAVTLIFGWGMWLAARYFPMCHIDIPFGFYVCGLLILTGIACDVAGYRAFRDKNTTINPLKPDNTSALVTHGIYRYSRNPMYLGWLLFLGAWGLWLSNLLAFAFLPAFVMYLTRFQIIPEERILTDKFGEAYSAYRQRVGRWY